MDLHIGVKQDFLKPVPALSAHIFVKGHVNLLIHLGNLILTATAPDSVLCSPVR
jgi:hypothetical protein